MMNKLDNEERYPLLLLYVEENGKKSEFPQRVVFADKDRGKKLIQGAAAIITQWPAQVTSGWSWFLAITFGSIIFFLVLILFLSSLSPYMYGPHLRCTRDANNTFGNKTIHFVKHGVHWNDQQLDILQFTAELYPDFDINTVILGSNIKHLNEPEIIKTTVKTTLKPILNITTNPVTRKNSLLLFPDITSIFFKKVNDILSKNNHPSDIIPLGTENTFHFHPFNEKPLFNPSPFETFFKNFTQFHRIKRCTKTDRSYQSFNDVLKSFPNIKLQKVTYDQYFLHTPLKYFWSDFNSEMLNFAIRVQELWQNGGISFHLPPNDLSKNITQNQTKSIVKKNSSELIDINDSNKIKMVVTNTKPRYTALPTTIVSVDSQGLHMATKTPCHMFFGEMLMKMQKDLENVTVSSFIEKTLSTFCKRGAVDSEYCNKIIKT